MKIKQVNGVFTIETETEMDFTFLNECAFQQWDVNVDIVGAQTPQRVAETPRHECEVMP